MGSEHSDTLNEVNITGRYKLNACRCLEDMYVTRNVTGHGQLLHSPHLIYSVYMTPTSR